MVKTSSPHRFPHIVRPSQLIVKSSPTPRAPANPAECFETALFGGNRLGLERLRGVETLENIHIKLSVAEVKGAVEGIFQDSSTFKLSLKLRPNMFMSPLEVVLAEFTGDENENRALTWLVRLRGVKGRAGARVRSFHWLQRYVSELLTTPHLHVPHVQAWANILQYIARIEEVCNLRHRSPRDPSRPRPRPRPRRSARDLVDIMGRLSLESHVEHERLPEVAMEVLDVAGQPNL